MITFEKAAEAGDLFGTAAVNAILSLFSRETPPTEPFIDQIWLDTSSVERKLKQWDGTNWIEILTIPSGPGSGFNADKLDDQEGTFYTNAENLTGVINNARLGALYNDSSGENQNPFFQAGECTANGLTVSFPYAFSAIPRVTVMTPSNSYSAFCWIYDVTTTGFKARGMRSDTQQAVNLVSCNYIAIGRKD